MKKKVIDLYHYRRVKAHYQKILEKNPTPPLSFKDYFRLREFMERLHKAKLSKGPEKRRE